VSDYSEQGAVPVEDAVVPDPPTVDELLAEREAEEAEAAEAEQDGAEPDPDDPAAGRS
jgi:hypothetical protein